MDMSEEWGIVRFIALWLTGGGRAGGPPLPLRT